MYKIGQGILVHFDNDRDHPNTVILPEGGVCHYSTGKMLLELLSDQAIFPSSHPYRARPEVFVDKRYNPPVLDTSGQYLHHLALVYGIKELFQVHIYRPHIAFVQVFLTFPNGVMRAASGSESVARFYKLRFIDWRQHLCDCLLDDTVYRCRYS